jgi:hypothetical protein
LHLRIPGWALERPVPSNLYRFADASAPVPELKLNGELLPLPIENGFVTLRRVFQEGDRFELNLPMPVRRVAAHDAVEEDRGRLAIQRGPLVYAAEGVDHGGKVLDLTLPRERALEPSYREDLLGGVVAITGTAVRDGKEVPFLPIPYFSWANRGPGEMAVWIPTEPPAASR